MSEPIQPAAHGSPLEYALAYAAIGWHVFPIERGTKRPIGRLTPRGHLGATTDEAKIRAWWGAAPDAGIGVAMVPSGLVTLDVDTRNGGHFDLEAIEAERGALLTDVEALTGGGGRHLVFLAPADIGRLPGKLARGIDLKADGYIVVEPSLHPSGRTYEWEASSNPLAGAVPSPLPSWIADMARDAPATAAGAAVQAPEARRLAEAEIDEIRAALSMIPALERETWLHVGMALHKDVGGALGFELWGTWSQTCPEKYDPQDLARVWRSFTRKPMGQAIQLGTVFDLAYRNGFRRAPPALQLLDGGAPDPRTAHTVPELVSGPRVAALGMPVQGLNDLARWVFDSSPSAHPLLAQATALALAAACAGRRYVSEFSDPASVYIGLVTPSASQARPMMAAAESALIDLNLRRLVRSQRLQSAQQVYAGFVRSPSVLYAADDWGDQLSAAKRQPSGLLSIAHNVLAGRVHAGQNIALDNWAELGLKQRPDDVPGADKHMPTLYRPALTLLAAIAEPALRQVFKRQELGRGALDCMLMVPALDADGWSDRGASAAAALPAHVAQQLLAMRGIDAMGAAPKPEIDSVLLMPTPTVVRFACDLQGAEARWIKHAAGLQAHLRPLSWGHRATMRRLCVGMAAFENPSAPLVRAPMLDFCDRLARECLEVTLAQVALLGDDDDARPDAASYLMEMLVRQGPAGMLRRDLPKFCKAYRRLSADEREKLLATLYEDDEITDVRSSTGRGQVIVARQFVVEKLAVGAMVDRPVYRSFIEKGRPVDR